MRSGSRTAIPRRWFFNMRATAPRDWRPAANGAPSSSATSNAPSSSTAPGTAAAISSPRPRPLSTGSSSASTDAAERSFPTFETDRHGQSLICDRCRREIRAGRRELELDPVLPQKSLRLIAADGEVDVLRDGAGRPGDPQAVELRHDHADDPAARIEHRAAAIAGLNRGRDLDFAAIIVHSGKRADDARGYDRIRGQQALKREADDDDVLARPQLLPVAECRRRARARHLEECEVALRIGGDHLGGRGVAVAGDAHLAAPFDDMVVGQEMPRAAHEKAGAGREELRLLAVPFCRCLALGARGLADLDIHGVPVADGSLRIGDLALRQLRGDALASFFIALAVGIARILQRDEDRKSV